jgi:hypothetical protein
VGGFVRGLRRGARCVWVRHAAGAGQQDHAGGAHQHGGGLHSALTPPDPQLKGAWCPGGFNPCVYHVENRFQNVPFKCSLYRYDLGAQALIGGAVHVECSLPMA